MTISKEERAELRERLREVGVVVGGEWNSAGGCEINWIHDRDGELCLVVDPDDERLATSVVNAAPRLLDALDASDERIAELEARLAEESDGFYNCARCGERKHKSNGVDPGVYCDACSLRMGLDDQVERLKARIAELEAAAQWRPIEEAPDDVHLLLTDGANIISGNKYRNYWNFQRRGLHPTHYRTFPALSEGGAK